MMIASSRREPFPSTSTVLEGDMRMLPMIGLAGLAIMVLASQAPAQDLGRVLRAITEPDDARRYEEQAHRNGRPDEERYWQRYGAGLQAQRGEEQAHRNGNRDQERYWQQYRSGMQQHW
jgi:hypothetical protein